MRDAILTAAGAALVAALNEVRASLRARQADRDRRQFLARAFAEGSRDGLAPCGHWRGSCGCDTPPENA